VTGRYGPAQLARLLAVAEPTAEQSAVIAATPGPVAVIAGAGSGKSETMAARLVWLVANGIVRPERVLGLTFTRKAAAELAQRVRVRLDGLRAAGLASGGVKPPAVPGWPPAAPRQQGWGRWRRMRSSATRSSPPTTPTRGGSSPITHCAKGWSRRCA
jgi:hypothetical protein